MRERGRGILVEGYLDCLMAHQHGFTETVAALGTAFTPAQLGLLRRHADEVIALFDADAAGQKAASRIEEMMTDGPDIQDLGWSVSRTGGFEKAGVFSVRVAMLPTGHDPDSLLRAEGAEALRARLDAARSLLSFVLDKALAEDDLGTPRGRATAHARVALLLSKVSNAEEATMLAREAGRRLGVDATQLWIEAQQLQGARARGRRVEPEPAATAAKSAAAWAAPSFAERDLLALLLHFDDARAELLTVLEDEDVAHPGRRRLLTVLRRAPLAPPEALMADLETEAERGLLSALLVEERQWSDTQVIVDETKKRYDMRRRKQQLRQGLQAIVHNQGAGDPSGEVTKAGMQRLHEQALEVHDMVMPRPTETGPHAPR
jgi:DNA primase